MTEEKEALPPKTNEGNQPSPEKPKEDAEKKEDVKVVETPAEETPKASEQAPDAPKDAPADAPKKKKKINRMTIKEIDKKLDDVKEKMGNHSSKYAKGLLKRKNVLKGE